MNPLIAVCIPIWNRSDITAVSLRSLDYGLADVDAQIYLFDNGSDIETRNLVSGWASKVDKVLKISLPQNFGIPYVVNAFRALICQNCEYVDMRKPDYVMLMDADAYFTRSIRPLLDILTIDYGVAVVSGHDSFEHPCSDKRYYYIGSERIMAKVKRNERMLCLLLRREEFEIFDPFPTFRNRDVDWEIFLWNRMSLAARDRRLVVVDWVLHLGQFDRTWQSSENIPASICEINNILEALEKEGLLTDKRIEAANLQLEILRSKIRLSRNMVEVESCYCAEYPCHSRAE